MRTKWLSNFWTVDGCLRAPTLVHTHKATQASVLHARQTHSWLACCALLSLACFPAAPGTSTVAPSAPGFLEVHWFRASTGHPLPLSGQYLSLGSTVPSTHTHQGSLLFSPPSRKHCSLTCAPSNNAKMSLEVFCSMIFPLGQRLASHSRSSPSGVTIFFLPDTSESRSWDFSDLLRGQFSQTSVINSYCLGVGAGILLRPV